MESFTTERAYAFDGLFFSFLRIHLFDRKSPNAAFQLSNSKFIYLPILFIVTHVATVVMGTIQLFATSNISKLSGAAAVGCGFLITAFRGFALVLNRNALRTLLADLEEIFPLSREEQLRYNLSSYFKPLLFRMKALRVLLTYGFITCYTLPLLQSLIVWIVFRQEYPFLYPFVAWYPFDDKAVLPYILAYCFQIISGLSGGVVLFNEELIFSKSVTQLCMHYRHLGWLITQVDAKNEPESRQTLKKLIQYQYTLTRLHNNVDNICSFSTFFSFTVVKISLCTFVFSLINGIDVFSMPLFAISVFALTLTVYLRCSMGTDLYDASEGLINSIYESNWYEGTPQYRKNLLIMLIMANKPVELQASPVNTICMEYFKEVMVQTYESFMFLRNFSD